MYPRLIARVRETPKKIVQRDGNALKRLIVVVRAKRARREVHQTTDSTRAAKETALLIMAPAAPFSVFVGVFQNVKFQWSKPVCG